MCNPSYIGCGFPRLDQGRVRGKPLCIEILGPRTMCGSGGCNPSPECNSGLQSIISRSVRLALVQRRRYSAFVARMLCGTTLSRAWIKQGAERRVAQRMYVPSVRLPVRATERCPVDRLLARHGLRRTGWGCESACRDRS